MRTTNAIKHALVLIPVCWWKFFSPSCYFSILKINTTYFCACIRTHNIFVGSGVDDENNVISWQLWFFCSYFFRLWKWFAAVTTVHITVLRRRQHLNFVLAFVRMHEMSCFIWWIELSKMCVLRWTAYSQLSKLDTYIRTKNCFYIKSKHRN